MGYIDPKGLTEVVGELFDWLESLEMRDLENFIFVVVPVGFAAAFVGLAFWCLLQVATVSGQVDYCFAKTWSDKEVTLIGHRPWAEDVRMGTFNSAQEACDFAAKIKCPLVK